MKNILVTLDFYGHEEPIIAKALEIAKAFQSKIWLLHVTDPEPEFVGFGVGPQYVRDSRASQLKKEHRLMEENSKKIEAEGIQCQGVLIKGATVDMISEEARKLDIDLIITGHHEHSALYKAFFGSVTKGVIKKADIPVLVVPLKN
jgi:nucleotide-binding universal stress UspA family protein